MSLETVCVETPEQHTAEDGAQDERYWPWPMSVIRAAFTSLRSLCLWDGVLILLEQRCVPVWEGCSSTASWQGAKLRGCVTWVGSSSKMSCCWAALWPWSHTTLLWDDENISLPAEHPATIPANWKALRGAKASTLEIIVLIQLGKQIHHLYSPSSLSKKTKLKKTQLRGSLLQLSIYSRQEGSAWCELLIRPRRLRSYRSSSREPSGISALPTTNTPAWGCLQGPRKRWIDPPAPHTHPMDGSCLPTPRCGADPIWQQLKLPDRDRSPA